MARSAPRAPLPRDAPELVLFDMDDTIFDHSLTCRAALARLRHVHPFLRRTPLDQQWRSYGELLGTTHRAVMLGRARSEDARRARFLRLAAHAGHRITEAEAERLSQTYREFYQSLRRAVPGAREAVRRWHRKAKVGIVTNNTVEEQEEKLRFFRLEDAVDYLVASAEIGAAKPDPRIFRTALARARTAPESAVMIGDSWPSDVAGARRSGIRPIWFNRFRIPRPEDRPADEFAAFTPARHLDGLVRRSSVMP